MKTFAAVVLGLALAAPAGAQCIAAEGNTPKTTKIASAVCDDAPSFATVTLYDLSEQLGVVALELTMRARSLRAEMAPEQRKGTAAGYSGLAEQLLDLFPESPRVRVTVLLFRLGERAPRIRVEAFRDSDGAPDVSFGEIP